MIRLSARLKPQMFRARCMYVVHTQRGAHVFNICANQHLLFTYRIICERVQWRRV